MRIEEIDGNFETKARSVEKGKRAYSIPNSSFALYGVQYDEKRKKFVRMDFGVAESVSANCKILSAFTAGGRLRFSTDSRTLEIRVSYEGLGLMSHMPLTGASGFSLLMNTDDGEVFVGNLAPLSVDEKGFRATTDLPEGMRDYTLYFPLYNGVDSLTVVLEEKAKLKRGKSYRSVLPILYYGSSITQGGCASRPDNSYQALICKKNRIDYINLGFSGNAKAEPQMVDYLASVNCSLFVCDYDHNAPNAEYLRKTHFSLYERYRQACPDTPILFLTKPDFERDSEGEERIKIVRNTYLKARRMGDKKVFFQSGKNFYRGGNCWDFAVDGCHPTDYGFARMAKEIYKKMCEIDQIFKGE